MLHNPAHKKTRRPAPAVLDQRLAPPDRACPGRRLATVAVVSLLGDDSTTKLPDLGSRTTPSGPAAPPIVGTRAALSRVVHRSPQRSATEAGGDRHWVSGRHCRPADPPGTGKPLGRYTAWSGAGCSPTARPSSTACARDGLDGALSEELRGRDCRRAVVDTSKSFARSTTQQIVRSTKDAGRSLHTVFDGDLLAVMLTRTSDGQSIRATARLDEGADDPHGRLGVRYARDAVTSTRHS